MNNRNDWLAIFWWLSVTATIFLSAVYTMNTQGHWDWVTFIVAVFVMDILLGLVWMAARGINQLIQDARGKG